MVQLKTRSLRSTLDSLKIKQVDWFKTDSQGTDLRLFRNLGDERAKQVITAEFEPGIASIYDGEDKLYQVLQFMDEMGSHWLADTDSERLSPYYTGVAGQLYQSAPVEEVCLVFVEEQRRLGRNDLPEPICRRIDAHTT